MFKNDKRTMDRLAKHHTVGSAIAPLIYGLKKTSDLSQFLKACEPVWEAVDKDHELCDSFVRYMYIRMCICDQICQNCPYEQYVRS